MSIFLHHACKRLCTASNRSLYTSTALLANNKFSFGLDTRGLDPEGLGLDGTKPFKKRRTRGHKPNSEKRPDDRHTDTRASFDTRYSSNDANRPRTNDRSSERHSRDGPLNARNRDNNRAGGQFRDNRDKDRPRIGFASNKDASPRSRPPPRDAPKTAVAGQEGSRDVLAGLAETIGDVDLDDADVGRTRDKSFQRRGKPQPTKSGYEERRKRQEIDKDPIKPVSSKPRKAKLQQVERKIAIPSVTSVSNLATLLGTKLRRLQFLMEKVGMTDNRPDRVITSDDASLIALEMGYDPVVDNEKAFDIYPDPPATDHASLPLRPPIVTIMGHVDHGKTTLLDTLRSTSVAASEAGGITQHIGAFEVPIEVLLGDKATSSSAKTITFLDTPGHAAFSAMRSRGRGVTDIVVIVVAADDGVMSQTREVIDLVKDGEGGVDPSVGVVVAITKCDKPGSDAAKAKESVLAAGLTIEDLGGDVPCIEVSAVSGQGLPELVEMINVLAEVRDLRAEREKIRMEGRVIESRVEKGRGNVATVLVLRGNLTPSTTIVAGTSWCRVRQLMPSVGTALKIAYPGQPVEITGWKALPSAGDDVLQTESEDEAKKVVAARQERQEQLTLMGDVEIINEKRRIEAEQETARKEAEEAAKKNKTAASSEVDKTPKEAEVKELRLIIKADVSGSVEAVVGCLEGIGNKEAKVNIVASSVGDVSEADLNQAKASEAIIVAFNVNAPRSIQTQANGLGIQILNNGVIYRLIEEVTARVVALLPPIIDSRVVGEGSILQIFNITVKGRQTKAIAGCRVTNGTFTRAAKVRILREKNVIYSGALDTFKQGKNDATSVAKGAECGISFDDFEDFRAGDAIQMYEEFEVKRQL